MERREAPGRIAALGQQADEACRADLAVHQAHPRRGPGHPGVAAFGVRAASDVGRCASRGSTAMPLSGTAPGSVVSNAAIDDALDEPGWREDKAAGADGDKFISAAIERCAACQ